MDIIGIERNLEKSWTELGGISVEKPSKASDKGLSFGLLDFLNPRIDHGFTSQSVNGVVHKFLVSILSEAVRCEASDIYLELMGGWEFKVRYRINGEIYEMNSPPGRLFEEVGQEIKFLFGLLERKTKPQTRLQRWKGKEPEFEIVPTGTYDNDFVASVAVKVGREDINLNLIRLPAVMSENYRIEIFDKRRIPNTLDTEIEKIIALNHSGLILLSSPPDNGKTTTAYHMLNSLNTRDRIAMAVERKASYTIAGINQVLTNPRDSNYDKMLMVIRAYHPTVIFFDDLTDERTAREALHLARNGTLVLAAVTATDVAKSIEYLAELGVDMGKASGDFRGMVSQRLLKKVHEECESKGCDDCHSSGYKGRVAAYQVIGSSHIQDYQKAMAKGDLRSLRQKEPSMSSVLDRIAEKKLASEEEVAFQKNI